MGAFDFQFDQTADGRVLKLCNNVDEFTREALVMLVKRSIDADTVVKALERLVAERSAPEHLRMDNGPEMTAHALGVTGASSRGPGPCFIEPGSPWQNPFVESFHSRVRDELLDVEEFSCLAAARVVVSDWQQDYNWRPSALRARDEGAGRVRRRLGRRADDASCMTPGVPDQRAPRPSPLGTRYARAFATTAADSTSVLVASGVSATFSAVTSTTLSLVVDRQTGSGRRRDRHR